MKPLDRLTASHVKQVTRQRRTTWFEEAALPGDEEITERVEAIGALVRAPAHTVDEAAPLADVSRILVEQDVPAVAVVDPASSLCGVITSTDLLRGDDGWTAADAMSTALSVRATTPIDIVADLMAHHHAQEVVVTDAIGQVVGVVTARDIARHLAAR
jgi:CBS domain-containing protein